MNSDVVDTADARVCNLARQPDFTSEALRQAPGRTRSWTHYLQSDAIAQQAVLGFIHLSHPASARKLDDGEALRDDVAGNEEPTRRHALRDALERRRHAIRQTAGLLVHPKQVVHLVLERGVAGAPPIDERGTGIDLQLEGGVEHFENSAPTLR